MIAITTKTAIITGASSGIGRATAIALNEAGWNIVITARRSDALHETMDLFADKERCLLLAGDIIEEKFVVALFDAAVERFGRLDLLFNNAGVGSAPIPIEDLPLSTFLTSVQVNLVAPFLCTRQAFRVFKKQSPPGGRIINNGSLAAHVPRPHSTPYCSTKHAISGLTKSTALDGRAHGITCTQIDIGNALTPMALHSTKGTLQPDGRTIPEATFDVKHVADTVVYIAGLPGDVGVLELKIMAAEAPFVGRG